MTTFLSLYNLPPGGTVGDAPASIPSTAGLTHSLSADLLPNFIIDSPDLAEDLVAWARQYLQNTHRQPGDITQSLQTLLAQRFDNTFLTNKNSVLDFYTGAIDVYSTLFVKDADQRAAAEVHYGGCSPAEGITADREWRVQGQARMVLEHKGRSVFDRYCNAIRDLATANHGAGSALALEHSGHAKDERAIVLKLGRQMIADDCQLGMVFGGHRFILFLIYDANVNGQVHHRMLCSRIHQTVPTDGSAGAIQVTIAALLGERQAFFQYWDLPSGIMIGTRETQRERKTRSEREGASGTTKGKMEAGSTHGEAPRPSRVRMSYFSAPAKEYTFKRVDMDEPEHHANDSAANLALYSPIGSGVCGCVFDADLVLDGGSWDVAAKFFDPSFRRKKESRNEDTQRQMFQNETEVYKRLADTSSGLLLVHHGAFYGRGFTGLVTYLILLEKLAGTFKEFSDMTPHQRRTAYNFVLELHRQGIHHGDVEARNFGLVEKGHGSNDDHSSLVIYDFSHARTFTECDAENCSELQWARKDIIEDFETGS